LEPIEVIGLLFMLVAFIVPAILRSRQQRKLRQSLTPEERARIQRQEEEAQYHQYEEFLRAMGATDELQELHRKRAVKQAIAQPPPPAPPAPPKVQVATVRFAANRIEQRELHSKIEERKTPGSRRLEEKEFEGAYSLNITLSPARINEVLSRPESLRDMILAREILDRPRGERHELHW
jgi:hypothetical protein